MKGLFSRALIALAALANRRQRRGRPRAACPTCGLPQALAQEVARYRRYCPQVVVRACPFDPRRGVWRLRR